MAIKLPKHIQKKILEEAKKNNGHISASTYQKITNKKTSTKNKKVYQQIEHSFSFSVEKIDEKNFKFILIGKHLSTNRVNSLSFREKLRYKSAIKKSVEEFMMVFAKKNNVLLDKPFEKAKIIPVAYNPRSRDDDGNSITLKILRDQLTEYNYIVDDDREHLMQEKCQEVINKEYKFEIFLQEIDSFNY